MTAQLVQAHNKLVEKEDASFEFVLVSYDDSPEAQSKYMEKSGMKFAAIKHGLQKDESVDSVTRTTKVEFIPSLLKVGKDGEIISQDQAAILKELSEKAE